MIALPLVWLVSVLTLIAAYALARDTRVPGLARGFLCLFLIGLGGIALLLGLRVGFEQEWAAYVQPYLAVVTGPAAYLGFRALTQSAQVEWRRVLIGNIGLSGVALLGLLSPVPVTADVFVLVVNIVVLAQMGRLLRCGVDDFMQVPPHVFRVVRAAIWATVSLIATMVAVDLLIVLVSVLATEPMLTELLTGVSGFFAAFVFVVALIGGPMVLQSAQPARAQGRVATDEDAAVMQALEALMVEKQMYRDNNLTLARVARRMSVPVRDVSGATNRTTGENFSRYVNGHRIRAAQDLLVETELPITEVMFEVGFISKSSFNSEFRRATGQTPSQFRNSRAGAT